MLVAEYLHYVEYVSGFVVFHGCFEVAKGVEAYLHDSWVLEFLCSGFALSLEAFAHHVLVYFEDCC